MEALIEPMFWMLLCILIGVNEMLREADRILISFINSNAGLLALFVYATAKHGKYLSDIELFFEGITITCLVIIFVSILVVQWILALARMIGDLMIE